MGELDMMQSYTAFYGKYAEQEWQEVEPKRCHCPACGKDTLEFLISTVEPEEVIGCTECITGEASFDDQYMVDTAEGTYLQCPHCEQICDTLYAHRKSKDWVIGCENCLAWADAFEEEE